MTVLDAPEIRGKLGRLRDAAAKAEAVEPMAVERERALINGLTERLDRSVLAGELTQARAIRRLEVQMDLTLGLLGGIGRAAPGPEPIAPPAPRPAVPAPPFHPALTPEEAADENILDWQRKYDQSVAKYGEIEGARRFDDRLTSYWCSLTLGKEFGETAEAYFKRRGWEKFEAWSDEIRKTIRAGLRPAPPAPPARPPPPPPREIPPVRPGEEAYPSRLPPGIQALRPDQLESVERLLQRKKGSVTLPTGAGKTAMSFEVIRRIRKPTAFLVPTIALLNQTVKELQAWGVARPGVFFGDKKELAPVTVFTYQDGILNLDVVRKFPVLIFDETDMVGAPQWSQILDLARTSEYALGMTATLERGRPNDDRVLSILPLLFDLEVREAIEKGILAPTEVVAVPAALTTLEQENYDTLSQKRSQLWHRFGAHARFDDIRRAAEQGDPSAKQILKLNFQIKQVLAGAADKFGLVLDIARRHPGERIMLFSETIDSIEQVCTWLRTNGLRCETYHSDKKDRERVRVLNEWGKTFEVLLAVSALNRGYNVPEVAIGIIIASSTRKATIIQRIGRIIRARPGKVARIYVVYVPGTGEDRIIEEVRRAVELS